LGQFRLFKAHGVSITKPSNGVTLLPKGYYFFVEIALQDGTQFGIPAYGEAKKLYKRLKTVKINFW